MDSDTHCHQCVPGSDFRVTLGQREVFTLSQYSFVEPGSAFPLPESFSFGDYIEAERELWALFPETDGKRVNFVQIGLTAQIYAQTPDDRSELKPDETYILMPCEDITMRPIRMRAQRRLTLSEYRMGHMTAAKLIGKVSEASEVMREVACRILGDEVLEEAQARMSENR